MLCSLAFRLWNGCPALAFKGSGGTPCVRVCCCWASALGADQWRLAAGGQAAIHLSSVQLCNPSKKKKMKKREKGRECTCWDKSFRCCFSSSFLISFKGKFCVCVWPALAWDSCFCFCFFLRASNTAWKPWGLKSNKTLLSHKLNASSLNSSDNFRK